MGPHRNKHSTTGCVLKGVVNASATLSTIQDTSTACQDPLTVNTLPIGFAMRPDFLNRQCGKSPQPGSTMLPKLQRLIPPDDL